MLLTKGILLYHGSYVEVKRPNLKECKPRKDFGRGFYVTTSHQQAVKFSRASVKKAMANGLIPKDHKVGYVSAFMYDPTVELSVFEFADADREWLHCVAAHRKEFAFSDEVRRWAGYDVLCGKIANDNTNLVITAYIDGLYGEMLSEDADRIAIGFLEPDNLKDQLCFRTELALKTLDFSGTEGVRL